MKNTLIWNLIRFVTVFCFALTSCESYNKKSENNITPIEIGNQIWAGENLNVSRFRNGDVIPEVKSDEEWEEAGSNGKPAWCYYDNDIANGKIYGKLYNWHAVTDSRGLCPEGWRIPLFEDWLELKKFLIPNDGGKLKATGTKYWQAPNAGATNETGFNALPGGYRFDMGLFMGKGLKTHCWSINVEHDGPGAFGLDRNSEGISLVFIQAGVGLSVRCIKE